MSNKIFTFELTSDGDQIEVHVNEEGICELIEILAKILKTSEHDHLMTPAWGGYELTEDKQGEKNKLINKVTIYIWS